MEGSGIPRQRHGAEHAFQAGEGMIGSGDTARENVFAGLAYDHDRVAAVGRFARLPKVALESSEGGFHFNQII